MRILALPLLPLREIKLRPVHFTGVDSISRSMTYTLGFPEVICA